MISLGSLPNSIGTAVSINNSGWVVGYSSGLNFYATEWNGGSIVDLGTLPGFAGSFANGVNGTGQVVGWSFGVGPPVPEPSTWTMMLLGFASLGLAAYRLRTT